MDERDKKCFDSIPNEGEYRDLIKIMNARIDHEKLLESMKRTQTPSWRGTGKRKKNKHL